MQEVRRSALRTGEQSALELKRVMAGAEAVLLTLARAPPIQSFNTELCIPYLRVILVSLPQFTSIAAVDKGGNLRCRDKMPPNPVDISDRPYFREVMSTDGFVVGTFQKGKITGEPQLPLAYPIRDSAGAVNGVIVATLSVDWLNQLINNRAFGPDEALTVADRNGVILARHPMAEKFIGTQIPDAFMPLVKASERGTLEVTSQDGTRRIIGYFPATVEPRGLYVSAGIGADNAMQPVRDATRRGIAAIVAGAAIAFVLAAIMGNRLIREPLERIMRTVQAWRTGDTEARTGMTDGSEIASVGSAVDQFLDELERGKVERRDAEAKRELLSNELTLRVKNNLATVRAIANKTFKGDGMKAPLVVFGDRLIALGNAYDLLRAREWQSADLLETVETTLSPYQRDRFRIDGPPIALSSHATLALAMALHELATNAAKYGALSQQNG